MNREPCIVIILPTVPGAGALGERRVRPDVLPDNVVCFSGAWHRRGRSDDPLRRPMPSNDVA